MTAAPCETPAAPPDAAPDVPGVAGDALTVTLTARTDGNWTEAPPAEVRLRAALKVLGRKFGLRASWPACGGRCRGNQ